MKTRSILAALTVMLAIGTALATEFSMATTAWSKKAQVPNQLDDCEVRDICEGGVNLCRITFDHDNDINTSSITADLYDAGCVQQLTEN